MELNDLVGMHRLYGVSEGAAPHDMGYGMENSQTITFELDGIAYQAIEDPEDGYRSSMREIVIVPNSEITNRFGPVLVLGSMRPDAGGERFDVLDLRDVANGKIVLSVGTAHLDDYYPSWVAEFTPENMSVNAEA